MAGTLLEPAPVVELRDAEQRRVLAHAASVVVTAKYQVAIWQRASDGSTRQGSAGRKVTGGSYLFMRSWPVKAVAGRADFTGVVRETTVGAYNITFIVRGTSSAVDDVLIGGLGRCRRRVAGPVCCPVHFVATMHCRNR